MAGRRLSAAASLFVLQQHLMKGREASGMTQEAVAERLRVSRRTFQRWELGEAVPDAMELFRWADLLNIEISSRSVTSDASVAA